MVPSRIPSRIAIRSSSPLRGGFIFAFVSYPSRAASVRVKYCGAVSPVTARPARLAIRRRSTPIRVLMCWMCTRPPVWRARRISLAMATSSAAAGIPGRPSLCAVHPSCAAPPSASSGSSEWVRMRYPNGLAYSMARRIRRALATGLPSSENATAPASASSVKSAISFPSRPRVTAATGNTLTAPSVRALSRMKRVTSGWSLTGFVFAMHATDVNPPAAAAIVPERMSSFHSYPGSRRWTCISTSPGTTHIPSAGITRPGKSFGASPARNSRTFPSDRTRCPSSSLRDAGSITLPPLMSSMGTSGKKVKERHPDGDAGCHLVQDQRLAAIGEFVGQFDPPVYGPWVHDHRIVLGHREERAVQAVPARILPKRWKIRCFLPLQLDPEHDDHIGVPDGFPDVARQRGPGPGHFPRQKGFRAAQPHLRPQPPEGVQVGTDDPAVQDVPHDGDLQPGHLSLCLDDGVEVQEP